MICYKPIVALSLLTADVIVFVVGTATVGATGTVERVLWLLPPVLGAPLDTTSELYEPLSSKQEARERFPFIPSRGRSVWTSTDLWWENGYYYPTVEFMRLMSVALISNKTPLIPLYLWVIWAIISLHHCLK